MPNIFDATKNKSKSTPAVASPQAPQITHQAAVDAAVKLLPSENKNVFATFCPTPSTISFEVQHEDEKILLLLRQHFVVNAGWILLTVALFLLPFVLMYVSFLNFIPLNLQRVAIIAWYMMVFGFALEHFLSWFFSVYITTQERILDIDFYSLTFKKISEAQISKIEDITSETGGVLQSILDFGNVRIQTAAEIPEVEYELVPHPEQVTKFLSTLSEKEDQEREMQ